MKKTVLVIYLMLISFALGKYTYLDSSGGGVFVGGIGGYHFDFVESSKSGAYK